MRLLDKSISRNIFDALNESKNEKRVIKTRLNESQGFKNNVIWSSDQEDEYYSNLTRDEMIEICNDNGWNELDNGTPIEEATDEELREYITPDYDDMFNMALQDLEEAIIPEIQKQCEGDFLVFFGEAANWHSRGPAAKVIKIDELESLLFTDYDATSKIIVNDGNLGFFQATHDVPTGFTMYFYSFKDGESFMKAEEILKKYFDDEEFDMYYFEDYADYKAIEKLVDENVLTPVKNTINGNTGISESVSVNVDNTNITVDNGTITIEDNGNTITSDKPVSVNIIDDSLSEPIISSEDNEVIEDIQEEPTEVEEIEEPKETEEPATEEPEETEVEEIEETEEDLEESTTEDYYGSNELARVLAVSLQKMAYKKYVIMNDGYPTGVIEADSDEEAIKKFYDRYKKLDDDNLKEYAQNLEIFQNPEFDYKITDITTLQPTYSGDVRALDMKDIIVGLDEALAKRYGSDDFVVLNGFQTKQGKDFQTALVETKFPGCKGYVLSLKRIYDEKTGIYECIVKDASKGKSVDHLCFKSISPVKAFESAFVDIINMKTSLNELESLSEDIDALVQQSNVTNDNGVIYTNDKRVNDYLERNKKKVKEYLKKMKKSDKFKVEEPDEKNTSGEEIGSTISKLSEEDDNLVSNLNNLKNELEQNNKDIDSIVSELINLSDGSEIEEMVWESGITLSELFKEDFAKAAAEDPDRAISMAKMVSDTNATYLRVDGYGNYVDLDKDFVLNLIDDMIKNCSLNESTEEVVSDEEPSNEEASDELTEEILPKAIFHRKPKSLSEMKAAEENGITVNKSSYNVINTKEMNDNEFNEFSNNLQGTYDWLTELYNSDSSSSVFNCIEVSNGDGSIKILVDPSGYNYCRYAAYIDNSVNDMPIENNDENVEEPVEDEIV